jgi:citrate lyase subunit beta/citryl-CoA lyase
MSFKFISPIAPLFVPGNKPPLFAKAIASGTDALIIDLEDAVAPADKATARSAVVQHNIPAFPVIVRVNGVATPWFEEDMAAIASARCNAIMLPKTESLRDVERVIQRLGHPLAIIPLIESAVGLVSLSEIVCAPGVEVVAFGSLDLALDLDCQPDWDAMLMARSELVLRSRLAGLPGPIDGVTTNLTDSEIIGTEAAKARALGFRGKLAIHPKQVEPIRRAMTPTDEEIAWADKVLAAASSSSVASVNGAMVDAPVITRARRIMAAAGKAGPA